MVIFGIIIPFGFIAVELVINHPLSTISYYMISLLFILYLFTINKIIKILPKDENTLTPQNGRVNNLNEISIQTKDGTCSSLASAQNPPPPSNADGNVTFWSCRNIG